jgi:hypothetical protein
MTHATLLESAWQALTSRSNDPWSSKGVRSALISARDEGGRTSPGASTPRKRRATPALRIDDRRRLQAGARGGPASPPRGPSWGVAAPLEPGMGVSFAGRGGPDRAGSRGRSTVRRRSRRSWTATTFMDGHPLTVAIHEGRGHLCGSRPLCACTARPPVSGRSEWLKRWTRGHHRTPRACGEAFLGPSQAEPGRSISPEVMSAL